MSVMRVGKAYPSAFVGYWPKSLQIRWRTAGFAQKNSDSLFQGNRQLDIMTEGDLKVMDEVCLYLDAVKAGPVNGISQRNNEKAHSKRIFPQPQDPIG
jgi:hypothetical protein